MIAKRENITVEPKQELKSNLVITSRESLDNKEIFLSKRHTVLIRY
ncbi:hypothetical protein SAMN04487911_1315 [Arenibacter nanhaiticus]|uniref:Uncharacterized protein n=1 Tax=Arenibacter nanhaiticus TaxID=558155 RepID=A0A1M6LE42_9FLAO|nr:hypothetical protein SAMN04487911_1315 [Arenibacter nanhaiticus]